MKLSNILRSVSDNGLLFNCPGCKVPHVVWVNKGNGPRWQWNNDVNMPTFTPSILVEYPWGETKEMRRCHSFITNGQIQFLSDCSHALAGQTVSLPELGVFQPTQIEHSLDTN